MTINPIAAAIQSIFDPIAPPVKTIFNMVAPPVQAIFYSIPLLVQTIGQTIPAGGFSSIGLLIESIVDDVAPPVEALIEVVSAPVEPFIDAIAPAIETVIDTIAEIGGLSSRNAEHEGHTDDSPELSAHLQYLPSVNWNNLPLGSTNAGSQDGLTGDIGPASAPDRD